MTYRLVHGSLYHRGHLEAHLGASESLLLSKTSTACGHPLKRNGKRWGHFLLASWMFNPLIKWIVAMVVTGVIGTTMLTKLAEYPSRSHPPHGVPFVKEAIPLMTALRNTVASLGPPGGLLVSFQ